MHAAPAGDRCGQSRRQAHRRVHQPMPRARGSRRRRSPGCGNPIRSHARRPNDKLHDHKSRDEEANASFEQGDAIRDYVFPLFEVEQQEVSGLRTGRFFLAQVSSWAAHLALTAAHVLRSTQLPVAVALVDGDSGWRSFAVRASEEHPTEDITVMRSSCLHRAATGVSLVCWSTDRVGSSLPYHL